MQLKMPPQTIKQKRNGLLWLDSLFSDGMTLTGAPSHVERRNNVLASCDAGVYVGNTIAGVTDPDSVRLVRWEAD